MEILAAKCPCCGRDIVFEENVKEYTCIFCGAVLKTAALKSEHVGAQNNAEKTDKGGADKSGSKKAGLYTDRAHSAHAHFDRDHASHSHSSHSHSHSHSSSRSEPEAEEMTELSEEEVKHQLERKAEFKKELHEAVKQLDDLRAKRPKLEAKVKAANLLSIMGIVLTALSAVGIMITVDSGDNSQGFIISLALAGVALFMLITSLIRKRDIKSQQSKLEASIREKKEKRDILIGRLNKINKMLHIHSDE